MNMSGGEVVLCAMLIGFGLWWMGDSIGTGISRGLEAIAKALKERK